MIDPRNISIIDYSYELPDSRIAAHPLSQRDASKLLVYRDGVITTDIYRNIAQHLEPSSLLLFNDTRVVAARIFFQKPTGGVIEIFCLEPHEQYSGIQQAFSMHKKVLWHCLIGGASKWKSGQVLEKKLSTGKSEFFLHAKYVEKRKDSFIVELSWTEPSLSFAELLHLAGSIPLPPYIKRKPEVEDQTRYQTVFAQHEGSVAAPTAGLHFTPEIFRSLEEKNIHSDFLTLHVGAGTFKPVKSEKMSGHEMHSETFTVSRSLIENILSHLDKDIIAVGTTSLRTVESLYWLGVKLAGGKNDPGFFRLSQWEPYDMKEQDYPLKDALENILNWMMKNGQDVFTARTGIIIAPGYQPRIVKGLVTNFHQPNSTLLLLVAAFVGEEWRNIYDYALRNDFRFLSYGDGCLLWRKM